MKSQGLGRWVWVGIGIACAGLQGCTSPNPVSPAAAASADTIATTSAPNTVFRRRWQAPSDDQVHRAFEDIPVYDRLTPFGSKAEFDAYRQRVRQVLTDDGLGWLAARPKPPGAVLLAAETKPCDPAVEECPDALEEVVTTASRARPASITNNQVADVDEGDVVKSWGRLYRQGRPAEADIEILPQVGGLFFGHELRLAARWRTSRDLQPDRSEAARGRRKGHAPAAQLASGSWLYALAPLAAADRYLSPSDSVP